MHKQAHGHEHICMQAHVDTHTHELIHSLGIEYTSALRQINTLVILKFLQENLKLLSLR